MNSASPPFSETRRSPTTLGKDNQNGEQLKQQLKAVSAKRILPRYTQCVKENNVPKERMLGPRV